MKILLLDIETAPNSGWFWGLFKQNIAINQINKPGYTLCYSAKWLHDDEVMFDSLEWSSMPAMLRRLWRMLDEADVVVHYNGNKFDIPTLNKEFITNDLPPPSPYMNVDLYQIVRSTFKFASNKLDFICQQLGIGAKINHKGMELWYGCMEGNPEDWEVMEEYNRQDVALTEQLYHKLLPWIRSHPNHGLFTESDIPMCPNCGSMNVQRRGLAYTRVSAYQRYYCKDCKHWSRGKTRVKGVDAR